MSWRGIGQTSTKLATVTIIFIVGLYGAWMLGASMEHSAGQLREADYKDALAQAQVEYDTLKSNAYKWVNSVEMENAHLREQLFIYRGAY